MSQISPGLLARSLANSMKAGSLASTVIKESVALGS